MRYAQVHQWDSIVQISTRFAVLQCSLIRLYAQLVEQLTRFIRHIRLKENARDTKCFRCKIDNLIYLLTRLTRSKVQNFPPRLRQLEELV